MPRVVVIPVTDFVKSIEDKLDALGFGTNDLDLEVDLESDEEREVAYLIQSLLTHEPTVGPIDRCSVLDEGEHGRVKLHLRRAPREDDGVESEYAGLAFHDKDERAVLERLVSPGTSEADAWRELRELRRKAVQGDPWELEMVELAREAEAKRGGSDGG